MTSDFILRSQLVGSRIEEAKYLEVQSQKIEILDPLHLDPQIHIIPQLNKAEDIKGLINMLYANLPFPDTIKKFDYNESIACMRDIGIFLGSIKKLGVEPVSAIPELEYVLDELHNKTDLPPRDTLFHYTIWNPSGDRIRTYTGLQDEICLIESVRMAMHPLIRSIYNLIELHSFSLHNSNFIELCKSAEEGLSGMINGIVHAKRFVSPQVFANTLRFYFEPILFYKKEYIGPGAVEMPLFIFDHLLWSSESTDSEYIKFKTTYLSFNLPALRDIYDSFNNKLSLVTQSINSLTIDEKFNKDKLNAAKSLLTLCNKLKSFRMPHKKLAEEAYAHQNGYNHGSGGYSTSILEYILSLNLKSISALENAIKNYSQMR